MGKSPAQISDDGIAILDIFSPQRTQRTQRLNFKVLKIERIRRLVNDMVE